jgi:threonine dehydratase
MIFKSSQDVKVYGVLAAGASGMCKAFTEKKQSVTLDKVSTFADGIAVKRPGEIQNMMQTS